MKVIEVKKIEWTEEEKDILDKATTILQNIYDEVIATPLDSYEDSEYLTRLLDIAFEYWK